MMPPYPFHRLSFSIDSSSSREPSDYDQFLMINLPKRREINLRDRRMKCGPLFCNLHACGIAAPHESSTSRLRAVLRCDLKKKKNGAEFWKKNAPRATCVRMGIRGGVAWHFVSFAMEIMSTGHFTMAHTEFTCIFARSLGSVTSLIQLDNC